MYTIAMFYLYSYDQKLSTYSGKYEANGDLVAHYELAGVSKDKLNISHEDNKLLIEGEDFEGKEFAYKIHYAEDRDVAETKAVLKDGILTLTIPKKRRNPKQTIKVE